MEAASEAARRTSIEGKETLDGNFNLAKESLDIGNEVEDDSEVEVNKEVNVEEESVESGGDVANEEVNLGLEVDEDGNESININVDSADNVN